MAQPKVSFVLLCYQQEKFIRDAVRSALAQDYAPLEIVISDDCSKDATFDIIEEEVGGYVGPHAVTTNRNPTNLGVDHLHRMVMATSGDLVVIAHGDDVAMPNRTRRLADALVERHVSMVSSNATMIDAEGRPLGLLSKEDKDREIAIEEVIAENWNQTRHGATFAFHRDVFSRFDPIDKRRITAGTDHILPFRAGLLRGMSYVAEPLLQLRQHADNWGDRLTDKTSTSLVHAETGIAYVVTAKMYMLEELEKFRAGADDKVRMAAVRRNLALTILQKTQLWTRYRVALASENLRPTWVDKAELDNRAIKDEFRVKPQAPADEL